MIKSWGFEKEKKEIDKKIILFKLWKGSLLFIIFTIFLSFFSVVNNTVYADKKNILNIITKKYNNLRSLSNLWFPSYIVKLISDYEKWKNILKYDKNEISIAENKINLLIQISWLSKYKENIEYILNQFKPYKKDIFKILWENEKKTYLLIFENTSEERPDGWFIGSFLKVSFLWWHLIDYKIYDSYKLLYDICKKQNKVLTWNINVFKNCDKTNWSIKNTDINTKKSFPTTTFINSNFMWFTDKNWENIIKHFKNAYNERINWIFFIKSDILKYLFQDWEKLLWDLEITNYKNLVLRKKWHKFNIKNKNIEWWNWVKAEYLLKVNKLLKNKKQIFINFLLNYKKIVKNWLIRIYLPETSKKFQNFLKDNNFNYYQKKNNVYLFAYNLWFNKVSKFVDKLVILNNQTFINPKELKLSKWINTLKYKYILNKNPIYKDYLIKNKIPKTSYLWSEKIKYTTILVLPKNCKKESEGENNYVIKCR